MRKSNPLLWATVVATTGMICIPEAEAAWRPKLPKDAGIIAELDNQTKPISFRRGSLRAPAGGVLGSFKAKRFKGTSMILNSAPVEIRVSESRRLQVRDKKHNRLITHPTALRAGKTYWYQVSCDAGGWTLTVNGKKQTGSAKTVKTCVSDTWGKAVVGASRPGGANAFSGTIDLTWYTDDGAGKNTGGGGTGDGGGSDDPPAGVAFVGDFEGGNLSQWSAVSQKDKLKHDVTVGKGQRRGGRFAGRMEVRYLDRGTDRNGNPTKVRAEVLEKPVNVGSEWWYGWSTKIDPAWKDQNNTWYIIQQFHQHGLGSPPLYQRYAGGKWSIRCLKTICGNSKKVLWEQKMPKDRWVDFVYQVRWSPNKDGVIRVWMNGKLIVDYKGKTCHDHKRGPYAKMGIYRGGIDQETQIIWYDEYRRGGSRKAVDPRNYR